MKLILALFVFAVFWAFFTPVYFLAQLGDYCDRWLDAYLKDVFDNDDDDISFGI